MVAVNTVKNKYNIRGKIQEGHFVIQEDGNKAIPICEGYATGASIHQATGWTGYVAFSANNLQSVALAARKKFPERTIIICANSDETGHKKGEDAAETISACFVAPMFTTGNALISTICTRQRILGQSAHSLKRFSHNPRALWLWIWTNFCP